MLSTKSRSHLIHKRHAQHKVYIPANCRENQYFLLELQVTGTLESTHGLSYLQLKQIFFDCCKANNVKNAMFVANDKYVRVRYADEPQIIETQQQMIVFYDPKCHTGYKSIIDPKYLTERSIENPEHQNTASQKIVLVIFANGHDIRNQACIQHQTVTHLLADISESAGIALSDLKLRDMQHITYDLFASAKGTKQTVTHGFREIATRYKEQSLIIPDSHDAHRFVVATFPISYDMSERLRLGHCDDNSNTANTSYALLYKHLFELILRQMNDAGFIHGAFIADGKVPFVSATGHQFVEHQNELIKIGYDPQSEQACMVSTWNEDRLSDSFTLVISPQQDDLARNGYGKFVNRCNVVLKNIAEQLEVTPANQSIMVRFHQHLQYTLRVE